MCHPAVVIGVQLVATAAQQMGQEKQAKSTYNYSVDKQRKTIASAADSARTEFQGIADRHTQAVQAAHRDVQNATKEYQRAQAANRVAAVAGNVAGLSVNEAEQAFTQRFAEYQANRMQNLSMEQAQLVASAEGIRAKQRARVEGTMFAPIAGANWIEGVAQVANSVFTAYDMFPESPMWGSLAKS